MTRSSSLLLLVILASTPEVLLAQSPPPGWQGVVFDDTDGDGMLEPPGESGLQGWTVYVDENENGSVDGAEPTTTSASDGFYEFRNVTDGTYVVRVVVQSGWTQTHPGGGSQSVTITGGSAVNFVDFGVQQTADPETSSVSGRTWQDTNGDGVQDSGEADLAGVGVELFQDSGSWAGSMVSGSDGTFSFTGLAAGDYYLVFTAPSGLVFTLKDQGSDDTIDSDPDSGTGRTDTFTLAEATAFSDTGAGFYALGEISGTFYVDANQNGMADDGEGVSELAVKLFKEDGSATTLFGETTSGSDGGFLFSDVPPFGSTVAGKTAVGSGYFVAVFGVIPGGFSAFTHAGLAGYRSSILGSFEPTSFSATPCGFTLGDLVWIDLDGDGLQDSGEPGLGGATLTLLSAGSDGTLGTGDDVTETTATTASDGSYDFSHGGCPDTYLVQLDSSSLPAGTSQTYDPDGTLDHETEVAIGTTSADHNDADFGYQGSGSIGDLVWEDLDADGVIDSGEPGHASVTVTLTEAGIDGTLGTSDDVSFPSATTDSAGGYDHTGLPAGSYRAGVVGSTLPSGLTRTTSSDPLDVTLAAGEDHDDADFGYAGTAVIGDYVWNDADGNGIQDGTEPGINAVTVWLFDGTGTTLLATDVTDSAGAYGFIGLAGGLYVVKIDVATLPAGHVASYDADGTLDGQTTISVTAGSTFALADFGFVAGVNITGTVFEDLLADGQLTTGDPGISGVLVSLFTGSSTTPVQTATTGSGGGYGFSGILPASYRIGVGITGYTNRSPQDIGSDASDSDFDATTGEISITALAGDMLDFDAGLYNTVTIGDYAFQDANGNGVQDGGDAPFPNVSVTVYDASGAAVAGPQLTTSTGKYSFVLDPGEYTVGMAPPGSWAVSPRDSGSDDALDSDLDSAGQTVLFTLVSGQSDTSIDGGFFQAASVGDLVWEDQDGDGLQGSGEPGLTGVVVNLYDASGTTLRATTTTDSAGGWAISSLPADTYTLEFVAPSGYVFTSANVGTDDTLDSDADTGTGRTAPFVLTSGSAQSKWDAGLYTEAYVQFDMASSASASEATGWHDVELRLVIPGTSTLGSAVVAVVEDAFTGSAVSGSDYASFSPSSHTFAPGSADGARATFQLYIQDDGLLEGDETADIFLSGVSGPARIASPDSHQISITDDDVPTVVVSPLTGLTVSEAGAADTFTIVLNGTPSADVTIGLTSSDTGEGMVSPATITFTPTNALTPQTVTVTGVDDSDPDGDVAFTVVTSASTSSDASWSGLDPDDVSATNTDDEGGFAYSGGPYYCYEDELNYTATGIELRGPAYTGSAGIAATFASDDDGTEIETAALLTQTNDPSTGSVSFSMFYICKHDLVADGDQTITWTGTISTDDSAWDGRELQFEIINVDNGLETAYLVMPDPIEAWEDETDYSASIQIVPILSGSDTVSLTVTSDGDGSEGSFSVPSPVSSGYSVGLTYRGQQDGTVDGDQTETVTVSMSSSVAAYDGVSGTVEFTNHDSAVTRALVTGGPLSAGESICIHASAAGLLTPSPTSSHTVSYTFVSSDTAQLEIGGVCDDANPQTLDLRGVQDWYVDGDQTVSVSISTSSSTAAFDGVTGTVDVVVMDSESCCAIGNYVWSDTNRDGIQDPTESPLAGVSLTAYRDVNGNGVLDTSDLGAAATTSASDGSYELTGLAAGDYILHADPSTLGSGYRISPAGQGSDRGLDSDPDPSTGDAAVTLLSTTSGFTHDVGVYRSYFADYRVQFFMDIADLEGTASFLMCGETVAPNLGLRSASALDYPNPTQGPNSGKQAGDCDAVKPLVQLLLDTSGSMAYEAEVPFEDGGDYLVVAKGTLDPTDAFDVIVKAYRMPSLVAGIVPIVLVHNASKLDLDAVTFSGETDVESFAPLSVSYCEMGTFEADSQSLETGLSFDVTAGDVVLGSWAVPKDGASAVAFALGLDKNERPLLARIDPDGGVVTTPIRTTSTIGDYVWHDADNDGLQDSDESGIEGITLQLQSELGSSGTWLVEASTTSDASGYYAFEDVEPGTYRIQASDFGVSILDGNRVVTHDGWFVTSSGELPADENSDFSVNDDEIVVTDEFTLAEGDSQTSWDLGLSGYATVGDFVWHDANHDGLQDSDETGIEDIVLQLQVALGDSGEWLVLENTTSDASGYYEFTEVVPDLDYRVLAADFEATILDGNRVVTYDGWFVSLYGEVPHHRDNDFQENEDDLLVSRTFSPEPEETEDSIDLGLASYARVGDFVWHDTDYDGVQGSAETGIQGIVLQLQVALGDSGEWLILENATSDAAGYYEFVDVVPGLEYRVQATDFEVNIIDGNRVVTHDGWFVTLYGQVPHHRDNDFQVDADDLLMSRTFTPDPEEVEDSIDLGLSSYASIGDYVWHDADADGIQDSDESGVEAIALQLRVALGESGEWVVADATTSDASGFFEFGDVIPGLDYRILATDFDIGTSGVAEFGLWTPTVSGQLPRSRNSDFSVDSGELTTGTLTPDPEEHLDSADLGLVRRAVAPVTLFVTNLDDRTLTAMLDVDADDLFEEDEILFIGGFGEHSGPIALEVLAGGSHPMRILDGAGNILLDGPGAFGTGAEWVLALLPGAGDDPVSIASAPIPGDGVLRVINALPEAVHLEAPGAVPDGAGGVRPVLNVYGVGSLGGSIIDIGDLPDGLAPTPSGASDLLTPDVSAEALAVPFRYGQFVPAWTSEAEETFGGGVGFVTESGLLFLDPAGGPGSLAAAEHTAGLQVLNATGGGLSIVVNGSARDVPDFAGSHYGAVLPGPASVSGTALGRTSEASVELAPASVQRLLFRKTSEASVNITSELLDGPPTDGPAAQFSAALVNDIIAVVVIPVLESASLGDLSDATALDSGVWLDIDRTTATFSIRDGASGHLAEVFSFPASKTAGGSGTLLTRIAPTGLDVALIRSDGGAEYPEQQPFGLLAVRKTLDDNADGIRDPWEEPGEGFGMRVEVESSTSPQVVPDGAVFEGITDTDGLFAVGLPAGTSLSIVEVDRPGFEPTAAADPSAFDFENDALGDVESSSEAIAQAPSLLEELGRIRYADFLNFERGEERQASDEESLAGALSDCAARGVTCTFDWSQLLGKATNTVITLASTLPTITSRVNMLGNGNLTLDGSALTGGTGVTIAGGSSTLISGIEFSGFPGDVVRIEDASGGSATTAVVLQDNVFRNNAGSGIVVTSGRRHALRRNLAIGNGGLPVDLGGDGSTPNDFGDTDTGPNDFRNTPVLEAAYLGSTVLRGEIDGTPGTAVTVDFYSGSTCAVDGTMDLETHLASASIEVGDTGFGAIDLTFDTDTALGRAVAAVAVDSNGNTSEVSGCAVVQALPALAQITIEPGSIEIVFGTTVQFNASGIDQYNAPFAVSPVWSASGGVIDAAGLYTGTEYGVFSVTASQDGVLAMAEVMVISGVPIEDSDMPQEYALKGNYPNPFNPVTRLRFDLPAAGAVRIEIFDALGRHQATAVDRDFAAGRHEVSWDARDMESGVYFYRITAGAFTATRQMVLLK